MIRRFLYSPKGLYAWLGGLVFFLLLGIVSIQNVSHFRARYTQLSSHVYEIDHADEILLDQQISLKQLEQQLLQLKPNRVEIHSHNHFVQYAESICATHEVKLVSLPVEEVSLQGEYRVARISFSLEGAFHNLIQVLYEIEQQDRVASIQHLHVRTEEIRQSAQKKRFLIVDVVMNRLVL